MAPGMRLQSASRAGSRNALDVRASDASVPESSSSATWLQTSVIISFERNERGRLYATSAFSGFVLVMPAMTRIPQPRLLAYRIHIDEGV